MFKKGDLVKCIDNTYYTKRLTINKTYEVVRYMSSPSTNITQLEVKDNFGIKTILFTDRFVLVPPVFKDKTFDNVTKRVIMSIHNNEGKATNINTTPDGNGLCISRGNASVTLPIGEIDELMHCLNEIIRGQNNEGCSGNK